VQNELKISPVLRANACIEPRERLFSTALVSIQSEPSKDGRAERAVSLRAVERWKLTADSFFGYTVESSTKLLACWQRIDD
jgi:hypothetical protein